MHWKLNFLFQRFYIGASDKNFGKQTAEIAIVIVIIIIADDDDIEFAKDTLLNVLAWEPQNNTYAYKLNYDKPNAVHFVSIQKSGAQLNQFKRVEKEWNRKIGECERMPPKYNLI